MPITLSRRADFHIFTAGVTNAVRSVAEESNARTLRRFFETGDASDAEPPAKKPRLDLDIAVDNDAAASRQTLTLLDLECSLRLDATAQRQDDMPFADPATVRVELESVAEGETLEVTLRAVNASKKHPKLTLQLTNAVSVDIKRDLRLILQLKRTAKLAEAAWTESALVRSSAHVYSLKTKVYWKADVSWRYALSTATWRKSALPAILDQYVLPRAATRRKKPWTISDFYASVHVPPRDASLEHIAHQAELACELFPFQKRAVNWMLAQEGASYGSTSSTTPPSCPSYTRLSADEDLYASRLLTSVCHRDTIDALRPEQVKGGILAEEMGLGKTVELVALICSHRRGESPGKVVHDEYIDADVQTSNATLIVMPPSLIEQWQQELKSRAPDLQVYHYKGVRHIKASDDEIMHNLMHADVVICSYYTLSAEIHYANERPERALRGQKKYEAKTSPLVKLSFWRVCLDEAQMIEGGATQAAIVARRIPRTHQWAVTGTPLQNDINDLRGLFIFLRYEPFAQKDIFDTMISEYPEVAADIVGRLALRHTKGSVRAELQLPPQRRFVLNMPFTAIEEQNYNHIFQQMCDNVGTDGGGNPNRNDWDPADPDVLDAMRRWLIRLRQTCLHPEVGGRNRRALGRQEGPLRTVDEVLEVMMDQNETELRVEERAVILSKLMQGHLFSFGSDPHRALVVYRTALDQVTVSVTECRTRLAEVQAAIGTKVEETAADTDTETEAPTKDGRNKAAIAQQRLRAVLELQHICVFFAATAYYQIKVTYNMVQLVSLAEYERYDKLESDLYETAKLIRRELLAEATKRANKQMLLVKKIKQGASAKVSRVGILKHGKGIESQKVVDKIEDLRELLNDQAKLLDTWRGKLMDLLLVKLLDQDDDTDLSGEEYEATTKQEDVMYGFIDGLRALISDRHCYLTGQINTLVNEEMKALHNMARNREGHAPEVMLDIFTQRDDVKPNFEDPLSVRGLLSQIRSMITAIQWQEDRSTRAAVELELLNSEADKLQSIYTEHMKILTSLERERDVFRATMNARLDFYKQVQQISDTVVPLQEEATLSVDTVRLQRHQQLEEKHSQKLAGYRTKSRFLDHLRAQSQGQEQSRICVICQSSFSNGVLTVCGHVYCKDCINMWYKEHRNCPMCKRRLTQSDFHAVTFRPRELKALEESPSKAPQDHNVTDVAGSAATDTSSIYSAIGQTTLDEINNIQLKGSFGTKIDTLCRHLLWLRNFSPGSKSVLFSQYGDFLSVLRYALRTQDIQCAELSGDGITRFKEDPAVECFLLSARSNASGLNLVNATHVFLCEPLINPAIELQAIARVHRIGQKKLTTVWMYIVSDSVEESIYRISVARRLEHAQQSGRSVRDTFRDPEAAERALELANSEELQSTGINKLLASGPGGGELVPLADLWQCLFGIARERTSMLSVQDGVLDQAVARHLRAEAAESRF